MKLQKPTDSKPDPFLSPPLLPPSCPPTVYPQWSSQGDPLKTWIQSCGSRVQTLASSPRPSRPPDLGPTPFPFSSPHWCLCPGSYAIEICTGCSHFLERFPLTIHVALTLTPSSLCSNDTFSGRSILINNLRVFCSVILELENFINTQQREKCIRVRTGWEACTVPEGPRTRPPRQCAPQLPHQGSEGRACFHTTSVGDPLAQKGLGTSPQGQYTMHTHPALSIRQEATGAQPWATSPPTPPTPAALRCAEGRRHGWCGLSPTALLRSWAATLKAAVPPLRDIQESREARALPQSSSPLTSLRVLRLFRPSLLKPRSAHGFQGSFQTQIPKCYSLESQQGSKHPPSPPGG